jgi:hypothetical protein
VGTRIEFNTVIALRPWRPELAVETIVPPENELCVAWGHPFRKSGHRVYEIGKLMPLVQTEGNQRFTRVLGLVEVKYYGVEMTQNGVETFGEYVVKRVFNQKECEAWLQMLNPTV